MSSEELFTELAALHARVQRGEDVLTAAGEIMEELWGDVPWRQQVLTAWRAELLAAQLGIPTAWAEAFA